MSLSKRGLVRVRSADQTQNRITPSNVATPIFVIGMARSGTKWLSNILCNHSRIAGVQASHHGGIIETNMLNVMADKFDIRDAEDYVALVDLWSQGDFFRLTGVDKRDFLTVEPRPTSCHELFGMLMDKHASNHGTSHWVQKTEPEVGLTVLSHFANARGIVIERDFLDTVKSTLQLQANKGTRPRLMETIYSTVAQSKMNALIRRNPLVMSVSYEQLRTDPQSVIHSACEHVGLPYEKAMLNVQFGRNTSFGVATHNAVSLAEKHRSLTRALEALIRLLPLCMMRGYSTVKARVRGRRPRPFIRGTFTLLREEVSLRAPDFDVSRF